MTRRLAWPVRVAFATALVAATGMGCSRHLPPPSAAGLTPPELEPHARTVSALGPAEVQALAEQLAGKSADDRESPCVTADLRRQLDELDHDIEALGQDDVPVVGTIPQTLRQLSKSPCFALLPRAAIPFDELTTSNLRWFWGHGGRDWAMQAVDDERSTRVVPPPLPESLRLDALPPSQRLFLCREASCAADTEAWRLRAERTINAIGQSPEYTRRRPCRRGARVPGWSEFDLELECEASGAGQTWLLPLGSVAVVKDGVLTSTASSRAGCSEWRAFDLSSGSAVWLTQCGQAPFQLGLGRVKADSLREATYALFVAPHVRFGATATVISVAPSIPPVSELGAFPEGVDGYGAASSDQVEHSLAYVRNGVSVLSGKVKWPRELSYPERVYLSWLLDAVDTSWQGDCSTTRGYDGLFNVLAQQFPVLSGVVPSRAVKRVACEVTRAERLGAQVP